MNALVGQRQMAALAAECDVVVADSPVLLDEVFRLRYQVYCLEKGYEAGRNEKEVDEFDDVACHVLLRHKESREAIGTVRIIPSSAGGLDNLPMSRVCGPEWKQQLPDRTTGEISRFAISKHRRLSCGASGLVRLGLMKGTLQISCRLGLTHWCAIMEPTLLRLLAASGIHFVPLGSPVHYHGIRQPAALDVGNLLDHARIEHPGLWEYATMGGALCETSLNGALAAA